MALRYLWNKGDFTLMVFLLKTEMHSEFTLCQEQQWWPAPGKPGAESDSKAGRGSGLTDKGHSPAGPEQAKVRSVPVMGRGHVQ